MRISAEVMTARGCVFSTSITGFLTTVCCSRSRSKCGVSSTAMRTYSPIPTSTMLIRNGIRHPQESNESGPTAPETSRTASVDSSRPIGTPSWGRLAMKPRRRREPHSIDMSTDPPHSPPTPMPCTIRRRTSRIGASTPIVS
jgi:hypothetical protein